jgi:hypothetical protein
MIGALVLMLSVNAYGVPGHGTLTVDARGNFARAFAAGPASESEGWNGRAAWRADATGLERVQGDAGERAEIRGWSRAFHDAIFAGKANAQTASSQERVRIVFGGLHRSGGVWVPRTIEARSDTNGTWTAHVVAVRPIAETGAAFAPPSVPRDATLRGKATTVPLALEGGAASIVARINEVPVHVYADSGGQNVITASLARRAGMHVVGGGSVAGGGGTASIRYAWASSVRIGGATLTHQPFIVLPDGGLPGDVAGIVGYEVFARFAARFDVPHRTLTLARSAAAFGPAAHVVPFGFLDRQPEVDGTLDGIGGPVSIDTGSSLTGQVNAAFVARNDLVHRLRARVTASASGVGGSYPIYLVRAHALRVGGETVASPLLDLLTRPGVSNGTGPIVNLGFAMLKRWIVVLDYPGNELQLRPGGDPSGNVVHDRSGLVVSVRGSALMAGLVLQGTPAARAGIVAGSVIARVNGRPVGASNVASLRAQLRGRPGTRVSLQFANGTQRTLVLERYL